MQQAFIMSTFGELKWEDFKIRNFTSFALFLQQLCTNRFRLVWLGLATPTFCHLYSLLPWMAHVCHEKLTKYFLRSCHEQISISSCKKEENCLFYGFALYMYMLYGNTRLMSFCNTRATLVISVQMWMVTDWVSTVFCDTPSLSVVSFDTSEHSRPILNTQMGSD